MTGVVIFVVGVVSSVVECMNVVLSEVVVTEYVVSVDVSGRVVAGVVTGVDVLKGVVDEHGTKTQQRILIS